MSIITRLIHKIAEGHKEHVERRLDEMAVKRKTQIGEDLTGWRESIIDVLKLAGENSSFEARADLAEEMGIRDYGGTSEQNQLMVKKFVRHLG